MPRIPPNQRKIIKRVIANNPKTSTRDLAALLAKKHGINISHQSVSAIAIKSGLRKGASPPKYFKPDAAHSEKYLKIKHKQENTRAKQKAQLESLLKSQGIADSEIKKAFAFAKLKGIDLLKLPKQTVLNLLKK